MAARVLTCVALAIVSALAQDEQAQYDAAKQELTTNKEALSAALAQVCGMAGNETEMNVYAATRLKATGHAVPTDEDIKAVRQKESEAKREMRSLRSDAKKASRSVKHWARQLEHAQKRAGAHESQYEGDFERREEYSEGEEDHVENMGDKGANCIETVYQHIQRRFEQQRDRAQAEQEKAAAAAAAAKRMEAAAAADAATPAAASPAASPAAEAPAASPAVAASTAATKEADASLLQSLTAAETPRYSNNVVSIAYVGLISAIGVSMLVSALLSRSRQTTQEEVTTYEVLDA